MKIAFVVKINFAAIISTTYLLNILKFLSKNHELTIVTNSDSFLKKQGINAEYVHISSFTCPNLSRLIINDNIINLKLKKIDHDMLAIWYDSLIFFKKEKPVLRFVDICPYQTFERSMKGDEKNLRKNLLFNAYIKSFKKSSFIITVSPQMKQLLLEYNIPDEKIAWLTFGVDLERFSKKNQQEESKDFVIISTVQFLSNRGSNLILESMKKLSDIDKNIKFKSIGNDESHCQIWNSKLKNMKLNDYIKIQGIIDNKKMPEELSKSKIGISILEKNNYYNRSPPQKIFEYMAMGLPIIANKIATHTDYIKDGYNGFIIDSEEEFIEAVLKLKKDKKLYKIMSKNSLESAKKYSLIKINKKLDEYVENIVK